MRWLMPVLALASLIGTSGAQPFYLGTWKLLDGTCLGGVRFTPYQSAILDLEECRITDAEIDGNQAVLSLMCASKTETRQALTLFVESTDPNTLRITNAETFDSPATLVRCEP
jgi:hypothetical protein